MDKQFKVNPKTDKPEWDNIPKDISNYLGFVYRITNLKTGQYYIGKKFFWSQHIKYLVRKPTKLETTRLQNYKIKNLTVKYKKYKAELKKKYSGKKKKIRELKESDWRVYWGSCDKLIVDINKLGKTQYRREIIRLCDSKWECAYYEMEAQVTNKVLFDKKSYNGFIGVKLGKYRTGEKI